jgi:hypothetical protein
MAFVYTENVSPQDRYEQIQILLDNGQTGVLSKNGVYVLSAAEVARAQRFIVLVNTDAPGQQPGGGAGGGSSSSGSLLVTAPGDDVPSAAGRSTTTLWVRRRT